MTKDSKSDLGATAHAGKTGGRVGAATGQKAGSALGWSVGLAAGAIVGAATGLLASAWRRTSRKEKR